jgi:hypothetical protein
VFQSRHGRYISWSAERRLSIGPFFSDDVFLGLSVLAGASFILALPMRRFWKVALAIAYIPIASGFLFVYGLAFVCSVFDKCM